MRKRVVSLVLVLLMVLTLLPTLSTQAEAAVIGDDYPYKGLSSGYDPWNFVYGNCTSFVAWRLNSVNGVEFHNWYGGVRWGGASNWGYTAQNLGILVDNTPAVGSIAWQSSGHVAWVAAVNGNTVTIEEYNWETPPDSGNFDHAYHTRDMNVSAYTGFIHIKDIGFQKDNNTLYRDFGDVFYAYIALLDPWIHIEAVGGENGSNVQLAASNICVPKQIWCFEHTSDGSYIISNEYSGKALEVAGSATANNSNVSIWSSWGAPGAKWFLSINTSTLPHSYIFTPGHCDLVMDVLYGSTAAGTNIQVCTRNGGAAQNFGVYVLSLDGVNYVKPAKPSASSVTTTEAVAGTEATISWTESALVNRWDARTYTLTVKDSSGSTVLSETGLTGTSYTYTFPSAGTYTVQVTAVNTMYYEYQTVGAAKTITVQSPCAVNGHTWDSGVVTQEPTATSEGVKTFTCTVCGETRTEAIPVLDNPFPDVPDGKFYTDAVLWAVSQDPQITNGYADGTFRPDNTCTRAQVVTFLWRAHGCPEPESSVNPFSDVKASDYYYKAVLWALENGVTTGKTPTTFDPSGECTRAQVVTFLWRSEGSPEPESTSNPFTDVPAGKYYTSAVLWALENGITTGRTPTTFNPDGACTRGHVVTFLYRDMA